MDFNITHEKHLSTVTITDIEDRRPTSYEIDKVFLPIRKAYLSDEKYQVAPTVITNMRFKDRIVVQFFGGSIVDDKITQQFVTDFVEYLQRYFNHHLSADEFSRRLTEKFKVEHFDISRNVLPKYARNLAIFNRSATATR
ncbi:hypothetical protein IKG16_01795 [Candidatus Saccharibacteria bacterium]|nr:hypothetical protein [Candidatus Saccharibacteria bacterium]